MKDAIPGTHASSGTAGLADPRHAPGHQARSGRRVHAGRSPIRRRRLLQDRSAARIPHHESRRRSPRPAGQRAQLSQESALRQTAAVSRQRAADERGRFLAAPAANRAARLSPSADDGAGRRDGRGGPGRRGQMAAVRIGRTAGGCRRRDDAAHADRRRPRPARRGPRSVHLDDRPGLGDRQPARRRELLVARVRRRWPTPKNRRFQAARAVLRGAVDHVISRAPAQPVRTAPICCPC